MKIKRSILFKVTKSILLGILVPGILYGLLQMQLSFDKKKKSNVNNIQRLGKTLALSASSHLWNTDIDSIKKILELAPLPQGVSAIRIRDADNQVIIENTFTVNESNMTKFLEKVLPPLKRKFEIVYQEQMIGSIEFLDHPAVYTEDQFSEIVGLGLGIISISLISSFFFLLSFQRDVVDRLLRLSKQAKDLQEGSLDSNLIWGRDDEIDLVGHSLEHARKTIQGNLAHLRDLNTNLESQVEQKTSELIHSARLASIGEMASGVAHEINNPLTIIIGKVDVLELKMQKNQDLQKEDVEKTLQSIKKMSKRIEKIVKALLSYGRHQKASIEETTFRAVMEMALDLCQERLDKFKVNLNYDSTNSAVDLKISGSMQELSQVVLNLINNSIDALNEKEVALKEIHIDFENYSHNGVTLQGFRFTDSGPPIPRDIQEKMLTPFFTTKEVGKGTGLGLSISKNIIESAGGKFIFDSSRDHPSFLLALMAAPEKASEENQAA